MRIIQIALGIVVAVLILSFWLIMLGAGAVLVVAAGLLFLLGPDKLMPLGLVVFFAWAAISAYRTFRDGKRKHGVPSATSQVTSPVRSVLATIENVLVMVPETESGRPCRVRPTDTAPTISGAVTKTRVRMRRPYCLSRTA
jgi:hypothetical protein